MIKARIIIHCSSTAADVDYTEQQLERDHNARGIRSPMGYHSYIRKDGRVIAGRKLGAIGAHAQGYNGVENIGICYEGGLKAGGKTWRDAADTRTKEQKAALLIKIREGLNYLRAQGFKPAEIEIIGHGQLPGVAKECPSFDAKSEYAWMPR